MTLAKEVMIKPKSDQQRTEANDVFLGYSRKISVRGDCHSPAQALYHRWVMESDRHLTPILISSEQPYQVETRYKADSGYL
jgi:hypothetical protein